MPKKIDKTVRAEIIQFAKQTSQSEAARVYNVSRMFVNAYLNKRPIKRGSDYPKNRCPITGF